MTKQDIITTILRSRATAAAIKERKNIDRLGKLGELLDAKIRNPEAAGPSVREILDLIEGSSGVGDSLSKTIESSARLLVTKVKSPEDEPARTTEDIMAEITKGKKEK
jgi:hypothetical protein